MPISIFQGTITLGEGVLEVGVLGKTALDVRKIGRIVRTDAV